MLNVPVKKDASGPSDSIPLLNTTFAIMSLAPKQKLK